MSKFADIKPGAYPRSDLGELHRRWLKSRWWQDYSRRFRDSHPWCESLFCKGRQVPSQVVDHKVPPKGDSGLFRDPNNHWALCRKCHSGPKQSEERGGKGFHFGCDPDGRPLDPDAHW